MYLKYYRNRNLPFDKKIEFNNQGEKVYCFDIENKKFILGGNFYYYNSKDSRSVYFADFKKELKELSEKFINDASGFADNMEGDWWGLKIDYQQESLEIFSDKLKKLDLYYFYDKEIFLVSNKIGEILKEIKNPKFENFSLISALLFYLPQGRTLFSDIKRLKYNEALKINKKEILLETAQDKEKNIENYSLDKLEEYNQILKNAILSRASDKFNLVLCSGGWDSTLILAILRNNLGKKKVKGLVMKVVLSNGRCFNEFEVKKVEWFGKSLDVDVEVFEMDYRENLYNDFEKTGKDLALNGLFYLSPGEWSTLSSYIKQKYGEDVVIFDGEGCDSLHNFGFSQFVSLLHESHYFTIYADKMKNYLFSPDFFKKIKTSDFLEDNVYKIFRNFNQNKEFIDTSELALSQRIFYYLISFMFSDIRIPFRRFEAGGYIKESAFQEFQGQLREDYFEKVVENINENNFYYYLSCLYVLFHLQNPHIRIYRLGYPNIRMPYIDLNLFKFLYKMPQDFGRGLEFRPAKFPLKELAKKIFSEEQIKVLTIGPHSYLTDLLEVKDINMNDEYLIKGLAGRYLREKIDVGLVEKIFDPSIFLLKDFIRNIKNGELKNISTLEAKLVVILGLMSIYGKN